MKKAIVLVLLVWVAGCGFKLRGSIFFPETVQEIRLDDKIDEITFSQEFSRQLNRLKIRVSLNEQLPTIVLSDYQRRQTVVGVNSSGEPQRIQKSIQVSYQLLDADNQVLKKAKVVKTRTSSIIAGSNTVYYNQNELAINEDEMHQELIAEMLRQIGMALSKHY